MNDRSLARLFLGWIAFALVAHVVACLTMITVLAPGVDVHATALSRATYVAEHATLWRLGWLPWHLCALSNVGVTALFVVVASRRRDRLALLGALVAVVATVIAIIPDQWGELVFDTSFVDLARAVEQSRHTATPASAAPGVATVVVDPVSRVAQARYLAREAWVLLLTGTCATAAYTAMLAAWLATAVALERRGRARLILLISGAVATVVFALSAWANVAPCKDASLESGYPDFDRVVGLNTVGFALLVPWYALLGFVVAWPRARA